MRVSSTRGEFGGVPVLTPHLYVWQLAEKTMNSSLPFRCVRPLVLAAFLLPVAMGYCAAREQAPRAARPAPQSARPAPQASRVGPRGNQEHLPQWMERHQNLSPQEQQRALESEPGFRQLPPQTQQRMRDRLSQLNAMNPQQRTHMLERAEQMEHLNPQQRQQVRGAMAQLGSLPMDRRRAVARAFRELREMPPQQRQAYLNSDGLQRQFSPEEQGTLRSLMSVEPLLPPAQPAAAPLPGAPPQ